MRWPPRHPGPGMAGEDEAWLATSVRRRAMPAAPDQGDRSPPLASSMRPLRAGASASPREQRRTSVIHEVDSAASSQDASRDVATPALLHNDTRRWSCAGDGRAAGTGPHRAALVPGRIVATGRSARAFARTARREPTVPHGRRHGSPHRAVACADRRHRTAFERPTSAGPCMGWRSRTGTPRGGGPGRRRLRDRPGDDRTARSCDRPKRRHAGPWRSRCAPRRG